MRKFKIDVNCYESDTFPVALYEWIPGQSFGGRWKHYESHRNKDEATEKYNRIMAAAEGLPIYLGGVQ